MKSSTDELLRAASKYGPARTRNGTWSRGMIERGEHVRGTVYVPSESCYFTVNRGRFRFVPDMRGREIEAFLDRGRWVYDAEYKVIPIGDDPRGKAWSNLFCRFEIERQGGMVLFGKPIGEAYKK